MNYIWDGVWLGLGLSILAGPILFALIQTSIEYGFRRGATVGLGIWLSDLLFILFTFSSVAIITALTSWAGFELTLGILGGIALMGFGIGMILAKAPVIPAFEQLNTTLTATSKAGSPASFFKIPSYLSLFFKGFAINTFNPFTVFFWMGVTTTMVAGNDLNSTEAGWFYGGVLGTVVLTDALKCWLAKLIRPLLKAKYVLLLRRASGAILFLFGLVLLVRVALF